MQAVWENTDSDNLLTIIEPTNTGLNSSWKTTEFRDKETIGFDAKSDSGLFSVRSSSKVSTLVIGNIVINGTYLLVSTESNTKFGLALNVTSFSIDGEYVLHPSQDIWFEVDTSVTFHELTKNQPSGTFICSDDTPSSVAFPEFPLSEKATKLVAGLNFSSHVLTTTTSRIYDSIKALEFARTKMENANKLFEAASIVPKTEKNITVIVEEGFLKIPTAGNYFFRLNESSPFYHFSIFNSDMRQIANPPNSLFNNNNIDSAITLAAGVYRFRNAYHLTDSLTGRIFFKTSKSQTYRLLPEEWIFCRDSFEDELALKNKEKVWYREKKIQCN